MKNGALDQGLLWMEIAFKELGQSELPGPKDNPRIIEYQKATTLKETGDEVPWCACLTGWCLKEAGIEPTGSAAARSYLNWGETLFKPKFGCVVVLKRGNSSWTGHVGFYFGEDGDKIRLLGGNQGDKVSIASFPKSSVLGYRWPK